MKNLILVTLVILFIGAGILHPLMQERYKESCTKSGSTWDSINKLCVIKLKK